MESQKKEKLLKMTHLHNGIKKNRVDAERRLVNLKTNQFNLSEIKQKHTFYLEIKIK